MKKIVYNKSPKKVIDQMLGEYSFKGGVRGKHYKAYRKGHSVKVTKEDGSTQVRYYKLEEGAVMLDPDIKKYFTDSTSVNDALRLIIKLIPKKRKI